MERAFEPLVLRLLPVFEPVEDFDDLVDPEVGLERPVALLAVLEDLELPPPADFDEPDFDRDEPLDFEDAADLLDFEPALELERDDPAPDLELLLEEDLLEREPLDVDFPDRDEFPEDFPADFDELPDDERDDFVFLEPVEPEEREPVDFLVAEPEPADFFEEPDELFDDDDFEPDDFFEPDDADFDPEDFFEDDDDLEPDDFFVAAILFLLIYRSFNQKFRIPPL